MDGMESSCHSINMVVEEIMELHHALPPRPSPDVVEAAKSLTRNVDKEEKSRIASLMKRKKRVDVPDQLFAIMQAMQKHLVLLQSKEQKREALELLELENIHAMFDDFIQKASSCVADGGGVSHPDHISCLTLPDSMSSLTASPDSYSRPKYPSSLDVSSSICTPGDCGTSTKAITRDDSYMTKENTPIMVNMVTAEYAPLSRPHFSNPSVSSKINHGEKEGKMSLIRLASLIEVSANKGVQDLDLHNKLTDKVKWLPDSVGKLSQLSTFDLSENQIHALPDTIGGLSSLTKLIIHSNRIAELPDAVGDLSNLFYLDLRCNQLTSLPPSIGKLSNLMDLSLCSNHLFSLPDSIGGLTNLRKLNVETNNIEELPYSIGNCSALVELRADYNRLKALPEAMGKLQCLELLTIRYNNVKSLPTTMMSMLSLKEIDVSFNELQFVPESLCLVNTLVKMNLGNNFADLQFLPQSIGKLEKLEELDISHNQIRFLPNSFGMLSNLRVLHVEGNPLEVPPRHIAEMGAQAVVQYMAELVMKEDTKAQTIKPRWSWSQICFFSRPNKRKLDGTNYVNT